jgi:hypothetical protein
LEVLAAQVAGGEWQLVVQTRVTVVGCRSCGVRAELHGRRTVRVRDLPIGGRPVGKWPGASASGAVARRPARRVPGPSDSSHRSPSGADRTGPAEACRRVGKQRTRQALRQAAIRLFLERGFEATTIADIAAAAEVAPRTFFSYYQTKEDVVLGEITQRFDRVRGVLQQRPESEPLLAAFRRAALEIAAELQAQEARRTSGGRPGSSSPPRPFRRGSAIGWANGRTSSPR